ncbi:hypothetical protein AB4Y30_03930 [Ornithinibacillus sp. 4-3]|uniref:Uncharacterized protein n=1 Tax=Ornithinibacillus sp. 4-3 TaxID=3231488 RepID=A0AB39HT22_9BACI
MFIQTVIDGLIQVVIFAIISFLYWTIAFRKHEKFLPWIGLKK